MMRSRNWPSAPSTPKRLEGAVMLKFILSAPLVTALSSAAFAQSVGEQTGVNSALGKLGIPPEVASQLVPQVTDYISKVAGPEVGGMVKGLFP